MKQLTCSDGSFANNLFKIATVSITFAFWALLQGCASALPPDRPAYVYVAANGIVTFRGEKVKTAELPQRLIRAGAKPETHIMIVPQGEVPREHLSAIVHDFGESGLPNCTIRENRKISVLTGKEAANAREESKNLKPTGVAGKVRTTRQKANSKIVRPGDDNDKLR